MRSARFGWLALQLTKAKICCRLLCASKRAIARHDSPASGKWSAAVVAFIVMLTFGMGSGLVGRGGGVFIPGGFGGGGGSGGGGFSGGGGGFGGGGASGGW